LLFFFDVLSSKFYLSSFFFLLFERFKFLIILFSLDIGLFKEINWFEGLITDKAFDSFISAVASSFTLYFLLFLKFAPENMLSFLGFISRFWKSPLKWERSETTFTCSLLLPVLLCDSDYSNTEVREKLSKLLSLEKLLHYISYKSSSTSIFFPSTLFILLKLLFSLKNLEDLLLD
jgi:hypothetical protein